MRHSWKPNNGCGRHTLFWIWRKIPAFPEEDMNPATKAMGPEHFVVSGCFQSKFSLTEDGKAVSEGETVELEEMLKLFNVSK